MPLQTTTTTLTLLALVLGSCAICPSALLAQQPYYYPAYGAHRGRISYHRGPFGGTHQKIRWGGGITESGAAVLLGAIDAAGPILSSVLGGRSLEEDAGQRALKDAEQQRALADDQRLQTEASDLLARTRQLRDSFTGAAPLIPDQTPATPGTTLPPAPGTTLPPATVTPSRDDFRDWPTPR
jgi:hypothetical protein